jgi:hypothetical protein
VPEEFGRTEEVTVQVAVFVKVTVPEGSSGDKIEEYAKDAVADKYAVDRAVVENDFWVNEYEVTQ